MAKPSTLPRWADTVEADATRVVEPTSGKKDVGWASAERPAAQHKNWWQNNVYKWVNYLSALLGGSGVSETLKAGGLDIGGGALVSGNITSSGTIQSSGNLTTTAGAIQAQNNIVSSTGNIVATAGAVTAAGPITSTASNIIGLDIRNTAIRTRNISPHLGAHWAGSGAGWTNEAGKISEALGDGSVHRIGLDIEQGETVNIKVECQHAVATANSISAVAHRCDATATGATIGSAQSSAASTAVQTLTLATGVLIGAYGVEVSIVSQPAGGAQQRDVFRIIVEYVR